MPVRLDKVPPLAPRPERPRIWLWLGLLLSGSLLGLGVTLLFGDETLHQKPGEFWGLALGIPILSWCVLGFGRMLFHMGEHAAADGWDEAREEVLIRKIRQGRRSQQVLDVSWYTALRAPGEQPAAQLDALLSATIALKSQPSRLDLTTFSHSRLSAGTGADLKRTLLRILAGCSPTWRQPWRDCLITRRSPCYWKSIAVCLRTSGALHGERHGASPASANRQYPSRATGWPRWTNGSTSASVTRPCCWCWPCSLHRISPRALQKSPSACCSAIA